MTDIYRIVASIKIDATANVTIAPRDYPWIARIWHQAALLHVRTLSGPATVHDFPIPGVALSFTATTYAVHIAVAADEVLALWAEGSGSSEVWVSEVELVKAKKVRYVLPDNDRDGGHRRDRDRDGGHH